jgi:hypothetical protein
MGKPGTMTYQDMASKFEKHVLGPDGNCNAVISHTRDRRNAKIGNATYCCFCEYLEPENVQTVLLGMEFVI